MAAISTHLDARPYQVASSRELDLEFRKWDHLGTHRRVTARDAAMRVGQGDVVCEHVRHDRLVFEFSGGLFVAVGF